MNSSWPEVRREDSGRHTRHRPVLPPRADHDMRIRVNMECCSMLAAHKVFSQRRRCVNRAAWASGSASSHVLADLWRNDDHTLKLSWVASLPRALHLPPWLTHSLGRSASRHTSHPSLPATRPHDRIHRPSSPSKISCRNSPLLLFSPFPSKVSCPNCPLLLFFSPCHGAHHGRALA